MSKRQEIRARRRREQVRNRLLVVVLVTAGALLLAFALIRPTLDTIQSSASRTQTAENAANLPINPITPKAVTVPVDGKSIGYPDAPVRVDVWEDFQCPACVSYSQRVEPQVIIDYVETGKVYYTFHQYPFLDGPGISGGESDQAANATMCALEQGRFWDYHDLLFANWDGENSGGFSDARLLALASFLGLDMEVFGDCFAENRYADEILADFQAGQQIGVRGTPSVFVNGAAVTPGYVPTYEQLAEAIEAALAGQE